MGANPPLWFAHNSHSLETKNPVFSCPYLSGMLLSVETEMLCVANTAHFSGAMLRSLKFPLNTNNSQFYGHIILCRQRSMGKVA